MWISEQILFQLARLLYRTEVAHSSDMKTALQDVNAYDTYRAAEVRRIHEVVTRYGISVADRTVMDFGCNDGALSAEYLRMGAARVIGVDIDERALERARASCTDEKLTFVHSAVRTIPLEDHSVDSVISYDVFEHVSQPTTILRELHRVLKPGGHALIGTWSWRHPFAPHLWAVMPVPWAHVLFSERTLLRVCRRVYHSSWYTPNMHDHDEHGQRLADRYTEDSISTDYLNKYLIHDFENAFKESGFRFATHRVPFGSRYARWTSGCLRVPGLREFMAGYVWFVLTKTPTQAAS